MKKKNLLQTLKVSAKLRKQLFMNYQEKEMYLIQNKFVCSPELISTTLNINITDKILSLCNIILA